VIRELEIPVLVMAGILTLSTTGTESSLVSRSEQSSTVGTIVRWQVAIVDLVALFHLYTPLIF